MLTSDRKETENVDVQTEIKLKAEFEKKIADTSEDFWFTAGEIIIQPFIELFLLKEGKASYFDRFALTDTGATNQ